MDKENIPTIHIDDDSDVSVDEQLKSQKSKLTNMVSSVFSDRRFPVPPDDKFAEAEDEFIPAPELELIGKALIDKYENDFGRIYDANILYLWKQKGGASGGQSTLGKCIRPTGLAKHFATKTDDGFSEKVDFVVWVAADHARTHQITLRQMNALIFHELMHTDWDEGKFVIKTHEFEGFAREIEEFGMWKNSIKKIAEACETVKDVQMGLFN